MMTRHPLVSVIIPVYNAEKFLEECVSSILNQDIGFLDNIELILINDGSTDASASICKSYVKKYPSNVVYIEQKNSGASHARNVGLKAASGGFISFVDADDYLSKDSVGAVMEFFNDAPREVEIATIRVIQFGDKNRERPINRKFSQGTRVVDLEDPEWSDVCPRIAPSFIRASVAKKHYFHEEIRFYEDTRYFNEIVSRTMKLGVVAEGVYYNRKHVNTDSNASITTGATKEKRFYLDSPEKVSLHLLRELKGDSLYPPLYIQYLIQYEMRWRVFYNPDSPKDILSPQEYSKYEKINREILSYISDEAIVSFKLNNVWQRVYLLNWKHGKDILQEAYFDNNKLTWRDKTLFNHIKKLEVRITDFYVADNHLVLKGYFAEFMTKDIQVAVSVNGVQIDNVEFMPNSVDLTKTKLEYNLMQRRTGFVARIPLIDKGFQNVSFALIMQGEEHSACRINTIEMFASLNPPRFSKVGRYLINWQLRGIGIAPNTLLNRIRFDAGRVRRRLMVIFIQESR